MHFVSFNLTEHLKKKKGVKYMQSNMRFKHYNVEDHFMYFCNYGSLLLTLGLWGMNGNVHFVALICTLTLANNCPHLVRPMIRTNLFCESADFYIFVGSAMKSLEKKQEALMTMMPTHIETHLNKQCRLRYCFLSLHICLYMFSVTVLFLKCCVQCEQ